MTDVRVHEPTPARLAITVTGRSASTLLLAGAALLVVGNSAHPADTDPTAVSRLALATSPTWVFIHLAIALGVLLVAGGLVALQRVVSGTGSVADAYARFGATMAVVGATALAIVFAALDGYGQHSLAAGWETAGETQRITLEGAAIALEAADSGLAALGIVVFFGVALAAFGRAIVASRVVAPALGWVAMALGAAGFATGVTFAVEGPTSFVINVLFRPVAMGATLYFAALAIAVRRASPSR